MALRLSTDLQNALVGRKGLIHAFLVGTNGAFVDSDPDSITDAGNALVTAGFEIGDWITTFGPDTDPGNVFNAKLLSVIAGEMTFVDGTVGAAEAFLPGTVVAACKGGSLNDIFKHGVMHIYSGTQPLVNDTESGVRRLMITDNDQVHVPATGEYGLEFEDDPISGNLSKLASQTWKGNGENTGEIGWFRFYDQDVTLGGGGIHFDGSVDLAGAQLNVASLIVNNGVDFVINNFSLIVPGS